MQANGYGMQGMGCGMQDARYGVWDAGCRKKGGLSLTVHQECKAAHPKTHLQLTQSTVDSCNNKTEGGPHFPSWPSLCKMDQVKACVVWRLLAWHPPEGARYPTLPPSIDSPKSAWPHCFQMEPHSYWGSLARSEVLATSIPSTAAACWVKGRTGFASPVLHRESTEAVGQEMGVACSRTIFTPVRGKSQYTVHSLSQESKASWQALRKALGSYDCAGIKPPGSTWLQPAPKGQCCWWWWWWYARYCGGFPMALLCARTSACIHTPSASSCLFAHTHHNACSVIGMW